MFSLRQKQPSLVLSFSTVKQVKTSLDRKKNQFSDPVRKQEKDIKRQESKLPSRKNTQSQEK
jgi:hypothetical protein